MCEKVILWKRESKQSSCVSILVSNLANRDIILKRHTTLGSLETIDSVESLHYQQVPCQKAHEVKTNSVSTTAPGNAWIPPVDVSHLTEKERHAAIQKLREEAGAFAKDDSEMGCIDNLKMNIRLKDDRPVQKSYLSIPPPLYREVKSYLGDLLKRGWIEKSESPYSSPVVCVRKKDGSLRLCIDYRELNQKTIPDRQPIPTYPRCP